MSGAVPPCSRWPSRLGLAVESVDELAEGHGADAVRLLATMAGESAVLCTHGDVATEMLEVLVPDPTDPERRASDSRRARCGWSSRPAPGRSSSQHLRRLPSSGQRPAEGA